MSSWRLECTIEVAKKPVGRILQWFRMPEWNSRMLSRLSDKVRTSIRRRAGLQEEGRVLAAGIVMPEQDGKFGKYAVVLLVTGALGRILWVTLQPPPLELFGRDQTVVHPGGPKHSVVEFPCMG